MGQDKLRKFAEVAEFKNCVEPSREEAMTDGLSLKGNWQKEFFKNDNPIVLELACGGGEYSVALAEMYPNKNFIGIDIKGNRIWKGASKAIEKADGIHYYKGIGEWPFIQQATVSIWENFESVNAFAYKDKVHAEIVKKTRQKKWYKEDLFSRFHLVSDITKNLK